jgi:hypothetical protein
MGTGWSRVLRAEAAIRPTQTWVASAGLGLIGIDDHVPSYSATFQSGHPDSIPGVSQDWWIALSGQRWWRKLIGDGFTLVQLSESYLRALEPGLLMLHQAIPGRLLIISPGLVDKPSPLASCILPIDIRIEHLVSTTRGDAGPAALGWFADACLASKWHNIDKLKGFCRKTMESQPPFRQWSRQRLDDKQIIGFIRKECTRTDVRVSASSVLRRIRDAGFACEQLRLRKLFHHVVGL